MKVILISGKAGSGKDTLAKMISEVHGEEKTLIVGFADLVKFTAEKFFGWNGQKDDEGRKLLQMVGTDYMHPIYPNYWVDYIITMLSILPIKEDLIVIPDARFPNEISKIKQHPMFEDVLSVHIWGRQREMSKERKAHKSETALDGDQNYDYEVNNSYSLERLRLVAQDIVSIMEQ